MRTRLIAVAALALAAALWAGEARSVELGGYFPYTLYTQGGEPAADYKPRVLLVLHGFKSAMPNNTYAVIHDAFEAAYTVAGYNYDYVDVAANRADMDALFEGPLKDRQVIVIGTSLGGFWADYMAKRYPIEGAVLINPAIRPEDTMRRNLGEQHSKKRMSSFTVTEEAVAAYATLEQTESSAAERLVVLTKDDEILNYRDAAEAFDGRADSETVVFDQGGHKIDLNRPEVMAVIRSFIEETWQN